MRDNDSGFGSGGQIRPMEFVHTTAQLRPFDGFKAEEIHLRDPLGTITADASPTMRLAVPPDWTHRDDLPCTKLVPRNHGKDPFDTSDDEEAARLCAGCPVRELCLRDALEDEGDLSAGSRNLVRGGFTARARSEMTSPGDRRYQSGPDLTKIGDRPANTP